MIVKSYIKTYKVIFEEDISFIEEMYEKNNHYFIIDQKVFNLYKDTVFKKFDPERVSLIKAVETNKTVEKALELCDTLVRKGIKRNSTIVSIGGGIIQDITGFVANVYNRGINWVFIPSTLLAMCDSCIGGKTSLNFKSYKNLLGTFYPPDQIYICTDFVRTLSDIDYCSGLGEIIKFNILLGKQYLRDLEENIDNLLNKNVDTLNRFILQSLELKKEYIEKDEFDRKERLLLNFAHTFGHAFENISYYGIPHGQAVALGTMVANKISNFRGFIDEDLTVKVEELCKKAINVQLEESWFEIEGIMSAMRKDKKQINNGLTAVLLNSDFNLQIFHDLTQDEIVSAMQKVKKDMIKN